MLATLTSLAVTPRSVAPPEHAAPLAVLAAAAPPPELAAAALPVLPAVPRSPLFDAAAALWSPPEFAAPATGDCAPATAPLLRASSALSVSPGSLEPQAAAINAKTSTSAPSFGPTNGLLIDCVGGE